MACTATEIFVLAEQLYDSGRAPEVALRSAVSRAYYAAFLRAREAAGISDNSEHSHRLVREHYLSADFAVGNRLASLRRKRNEADYEITKSFDSKTAGGLLRQAKAVLDNV